MLGLHARALAVHLGPWIGGVELDVLDVAAERHRRRALAALFEAQQDLVLDLQVPGEVEFAGLQHGARRRDRIAAALHLDRVEIGPVRHVVVVVDLAAHHVARLEVDELVGAGADRLEVGRGVARLRADVVGVQVLRDDHAAHADESIGPERRRLVEQDAHRVAVDLLDLAVLVAADGGGGGRRVGGVLPVEHDVVGGERLAVVPLHALLELPGDRLAVLGEPAVLEIRDLGGEDRRERALHIPGGERLVEDAAAVLVLGADREMRIEQGRALPPQRLERPAAAALGRLVRVRLCLRLRDARIGEHLHRERRGQPVGDHLIDEGAARELAALNVSDQATQSLLVHVKTPRLFRPFARPDATRGPSRFGCKENILGAYREMRIEQGRTLPPKRLERPAAAALGRLVRVRLCLRLCDARIGEHLHREWCGQPVGDHLIDEGAARELAALNVSDQATQSLLVHVKTPRLFRPLAKPDATRGPSRFGCKENRLARDGQRRGRGRQCYQCRSGCVAL